MDYTLILMHLNIVPGMKFLDDIVANKECKLRGAHTVQGLLFESVFSEFTFGCQPTGEGDRKDRKGNYEDKKYVVTFTGFIFSHLFSESL